MKPETPEMPDMPEAPISSDSLKNIVEKSRVIVCCGAGGVGKTTTAGGLAILGARLGKRVLVLTIDPSKRLAETLGVAQNPPHPVQLEPERLKRAGVKSNTGSLDAWMLDPKQVTDNAIRRIIINPSEAEKLLQNRIYQQLTTIVAGMHEYTAMHALHGFVQEGRYDLVVLDTPPSRHALDFLEAPARIAGFLDGRIFKLFLPKEAASGIGRITKMASGLVSKVFNSVLGDTLASEITVFFSVFSNVMKTAAGDVNQMRSFLSGPEVSFLLVTSPAPAALEEAMFFQRKTDELHLPFRGFILNRSHVHSSQKPRVQKQGIIDPILISAIDKLNQLAENELALIDRDKTLLLDLEKKAALKGAIATALPVLPRTEDEMMNLCLMADHLSI